jgi:hypothetical protein
MTVQTVELSSIDVKKKRVSLLSLPFRVILVFMALFGFLMSILLAITIVLIPIAILMWLGSVAFIALAFNLGAKVKCPHCHREQVASVYKENFKCRKCTNVTMVNWVK